MIEMQFLLEFRISKKTGGGLPGENRENQNQEETKKEPGKNQKGPMKNRKRLGSENVMKVDGFR